MVERKTVQKIKNGIQPAIHSRLPGPTGYQFFLLGKEGKKCLAAKKLGKIDFAKFYDYRS
jgi:hypothetical protein